MPGRRINSPSNPDPSQTPQVFRGRLVLPDKVIDQGVLVCRNGSIDSIRRNSRVPRDATVIESNGGWIVPGFIDIHVHGAAVHQAR